ncbi:MAG TPA: M48 family metallopeptidase [Burkholderiales bacterium]|nr:M48 family metallopeptidase [Burkholderiales bacterium]
MASFFENQQLARRNTKLLVLMYVLAVAGVIIAVDLVVAAGYLYGLADLYVPKGRTPGALALLRIVPARVYVMGGIGTAIVILAVSAWHMMQLSSGGKAVAEMVGARRVTSDTREPLERRLVNVVEEMAIASGVRVPAVYVMDGEQGINAFAAGYDVSDSIVAVTRGTLETLNRDELQGVIGHEFSHILNGDMRLNIRMIGVLAGIVFIGSIGDFLMRSQRGSSDSKGTVPIFLAGLALLLIGYVGLFFARLIKAAVSRQREFLADASSVQFTRNPDGIAGALDQIAVSSAGALIANRHAEDVSHMFFGQGIQVRLSGLFDTHPPLEERIARVHQRFDRASYRKSRASAGAEAVVERDSSGKSISPKDAATAVLGGAVSMGFAGRRNADLGTQWGRSAGESAKLVGSMDGGKVDYAARLLGALPPELRDKLRDPATAGAALVALLLAPKDDVMQTQIQALEAAGLGAIAGEARAIAPFTRRLGSAFHMPVIDLALPALKSAPEEAKRQLLAALEVVINADRRVSLHEFVVLTFVRSQLAPGKPGAAGSKRIADLQPEAVIVLSLIAYAGIRQDATGKRGEELAAAMRAGTKEMGIAEAPAATALRLEVAAAALESLKRLAPMQKAILVKGLFAAVSADGAIRVAEAELMRLVGAVLDCPLPPLLESVDPATLAE